ncbi:MAG: hypothetical protein PUB99_03370 [Oscillospiraceae bacterium]|nr:hypothetical protein [Oscillospiraceae bacterium]
MKARKTAAFLLAVTVLVFLLAGCRSAQPTAVQDSTVSEQMYEIIADDPFA